MKSGIVVLKSLENHIEEDVEKKKMVSRYNTKKKEIVKKISIN